MSLDQKTKNPPKTILIDFGNDAGKLQYVVPPGRVVRGRLFTQSHDVGNQAIRVRIRNNTGSTETRYVYVAGNIVASASGDPLIPPLPMEFGPGTELEDHSTSSSLYFAGLEEDF